MIRNLISSNKKNIKHIFSAVLILCCISFISVYAADKPTAPTAATFEVSPVFGDNMVFQQNEPIRVWGTSECEGDMVMVKLGASLDLAEVKDGKWEAELAARTRSKEPVTLEILGSDSSSYTTFENITIGDVWWVVGQSNVEFDTASTPDRFEFEQSLTGEESLYLYTPNFDTFKKPTDTRWRKFSKYSTYDDSALSCYFAKKIADSTSNEIPLAMVNVGFAGRDLASFMPSELCKDASSAGNPSEIYDKVISHMIKMPIKGLIWYQGEADAAYYADYQKKLKSLFKWFRDKKKQDNKNFPIYCVELYPCFPDENDPDRQFIDFGNVRAETGALASQLDNLYICVTSDLWAEKEYSNNIHPTNKSTLASRLASMILAKEYGFGNESNFFGPSFKSATLSENDTVAKITFDNVGEGLENALSDGFLVIGENWKPITDFQISIASSDTIAITAKEKIYVIKYNYQTDGVFNENLFLKNSFGIPAAAFSHQFKNPSTVQQTPNYRRYIKIILLGLVLLAFAAGALFAIIFISKRKSNKQ